jgi:AcrR family transcriptional regulator
VRIVKLPDETKPDGRPKPDGRGAGRPFDRSGDSVILQVTLDLLAERDYERVSLDDVAARTGKAKTTLYRRWATKEDLVVAAILSAGRPPEAERLPDLGSLRSDLLAVVESQWLGGADRRLAVFLSLAPAARTSTRLAETIRSEVSEPYVEIYRRLLQRAVDRGEVAVRFAPRIATLAEVVPAMSTNRLGAGSGPVPRQFFVSVIDDVVLAALGLSAG